MVKPKPPSTDVLIDRFLNYLLVEKGLAQKTIEAYSRDIIRYRNFIAANKSTPFSEEDTPLILKHLILLRKDGLKARSRARHHRRTSRLSCGWAAARSMRSPRWFSIPKDRRAGVATSASAPLLLLASRTQSEAIGE